MEPIGYPRRRREHRQKGDRPVPAPVEPVEVLPSSVKRAEGNHHHEIDDSVKNHGRKANGGEPCPHVPRGKQESKDPGDRRERVKVEGSPEVHHPPPLSRA